MVEKLNPNILREQKGLSFTGITTIFICHDGNNKIFLHKRSSNTRDEHGCWDPGAGGLKHGQSVQQNVKRELLEEYGVEPISMDFLGYLDVFRSNAELQSTHWLAMFFVIKVDPKEVRIMEPDNVSDSGWFALDNLPTPMHSQFGNLLDEYREQIVEILSI